MKKLQKKINDTYLENFGYTPLNNRLKDIQNEFFELMKWQDVKNLKEETGDLLSSLIQLCNENDWKVEDLISDNIAKIESRAIQYKTLGRKTKVAIYGGAFSPITTGHVEAAKFVLDTSNEFDEVWIMPSFGHMSKSNLVSPEHRLEMCRLATESDGRIKVFDYEIVNKLGGETYNFFKRLKLDEELNSRYNFSMIIGLDNANDFNKWVNFEDLERFVRFVVIPRKGIERNYDVDWYLKAPHIFLNKENHVPDVSSTMVRGLIQDAYKYGILYSDEYYELTLKPFIDKKVFDYILDNKLYQVE